MRGWIKFDPNDSKTWPESEKEVLFAAPNLLNKPIYGYCVNYYSRAKIMLYHMYGCRQTKANNIKAWQYLPAMPEEENA